MGDNESVLFEVNGDFGLNEKRNLVGVAIRLVGDLFLTGPDSFIKFITEHMRNQFEVEVLDANEAIYLGMQIDKALGDSESSARIKLGPNRNEGEFAISRFSTNGHRMRAIL